MANEITATEAEWKPKHNPWLVTISVMIATFIFVLDSTIASVALPHMAGSFAASNDEAMWILTSYMIASGIILPSVDWFSKIFGRKVFFINCIIIFTIASVMCGLAKNLETMILARVIQGIGGGALLPVSQAIMLESFPKEKRGLAMSVFGFGVVVAPIIGPVLGGWITDSYSWSWIFFLNLPFGIIAAILSNIFVEDPPYAQKQGMQKIDYIGFMFLIIWLVSLQTVLDKGQNADWFQADWICWLTALSIFSMIAFIVSQLKNKKPIIDLSIFKERNYTFGTLILFFISIVMYSSIAVMPLFLQNLLGYSAFLSGYATAPRGIGSITAIAVCAALNNKIDERIIVTCALILFGVAGLMFGFLNLDISIGNIIIPNLIMGAALGFTFIPMTTLSMTNMPDSQLTNASGAQTLIRTIGGAMGTSLVATCLQRFAQVHQFNMVGFLNPLNPVFTQRVAAMQSFMARYTNMNIAEQKANYMMYASLIKQSNLWAYMDSFRFFGIFALCIIPLAWAMKRHRI